MHQRMLISAPFFPYDAIEASAHQPDVGTYLSEFGAADNIQVIEGFGGLGISEVSFLEMMPELEGFSLDQVDPQALERARRACLGCQTTASIAMAGCAAIQNSAPRAQCIRTAEATRDACCATYNAMLASGGGAPLPPDKTSGGGLDPSGGSGGGSGGSSGGDSKTLLYVGGAIGLALVGLLAVVALRK